MKQTTVTNSVKPDALQEASINLVMADSNTAQPQGWQAKLELGFERQYGKTVLAHRRHIGPLTVQRPFYPEGGVCHIYVLHPPGGVVAG